MHLRRALATTTTLLLLSSCTAEPVTPPGTNIPDVDMSGDRVPTAQGDIVIHPINHATLALGWLGKTHYVDPVGDAARFEGLPAADVILVTDLHADHLSVERLSALVTPDTVIVAPQAVYTQLPAALQAVTRVLANGETTSVAGLRVEAVPMYNLTPERLGYHEKGRGNGYVLSDTQRRVYIAGDTEDTPEMRALRDIDVAFVPMNLPYTMTVQQAADAVRAFTPGIVYPYHSRGSDLNEFKRLVGPDGAIEVRLRAWY